MIADADGRVDAARYVASPNCDERPPGEAITLLVIHNISLPPGEFGGDGIVRLFTNALDCAAHPYYRDPGRRAGVGALPDPSHGRIAAVRALHEARLARRSVRLARAQRLQRLLHRHRTGGHGRCALHRGAIPRAGRTRARAAAAYPIADIAGHCDIAPARKTDPGPSFDWPRFRSAIA